MRICLLSYRGNMYCGGQGVYVYYLGQHLAKLGHEVHLIQGPPYTWDIPGVTLHKLPNFNFFATRKFFTRFVPPGADLLQLFHPLHFYEFAATRFGFFPEMAAFSFRAWRKLVELSADRPFDIVHDNQTLAWGLLLIQALGLPVVTTLHHPLAEDLREDFQQLPHFNDRFRRALYYPVLMNKQVTARLSELVTVSQTAARSCARAFGIPEARIRVIYNGVDVETFRPDPAAQKIPGRLIFVGNTEDRKKGIRYLLEAMMLLPKEVTLTVVDGGAPRHLLMEELRRKFNLGDRVQCTGKIPTAELVKKYHEAEIAVSPSLYEGFGFPAAEAMACGLPVVSSDGGALPEVVGTDGKAGFVVPRRDPAALAQAVKKLLDDPGLRERMGQAGRKRVEENFSWDAACRQMIALYQEAIARQRCRRLV